MLANVNIGMIIANDDGIALLLTALTDHISPEESTTKSWNYSSELKINFALSGDMEFGPEPGSNARNNTKLFFM